MISRPLVLYAKAAGAAMVTIALVVGVPVGLVTLVGWPLPRSLPSPAEVGDAFARQGVPTEVVVKALAVIVWLAWAQIVWAFAVEAVAVVRGRAAQRAAVLPGVQVLAGRLIAGIALVASAVGPARPAGAAALTAPPPVPVAALPFGVPEPSAASRATAPSPPAPPAAAPAVPDGEHMVYETQRGDTFWRLAQYHLGSGTRWREIRDLNVGRAVAAGCVLAADQDRLQPGWRILLPTPARQVAPPPSPPPSPATASGPLAAEPAGVPGGSDAPLLPAAGMVRYDEDDLAPGGGLASRGLASGDDLVSPQPDEIHGLTVAFTGDTAAGDPAETGRGGGMVLYDEDDLLDEERSAQAVRETFAHEPPPWRPRPAHMARRRRR